MAVTNSATIDGRLITVNSGADQDSQAKGLLATLEKLFERGTKITEGARIQLGWSVLTLTKLSENSLVVCEPDFAGNPFEDTVNSVDISLRVLSRQQKLAQSIGAAQVSISFQDKVVISKDILACASLRLERVSPKPEDGDSGWFIGAKNPNENSEELNAVYAFQLLQKRPELVDVLTLPECYMVFFDGPNLSCVLNEQDEMVFP